MNKSEILRSYDPVAVLGTDFQHGFKELVKVWHPDRNKDPDAARVMTKLQELRAMALGVFEETVTIAAGHLTIKGSTVTLFTKESDGLFAAKQMEKLRGISPGMLKRVPEVIERTKDNVVMRLPAGVRSLARIMAKHPEGLESNHVAWMLSRLYEQTYMLANESGGVHCGLTPETLFIDPATHGLFSVDWRFFMSINQRLYKVPGPLVSFVGPDKVATSLLDLRAANRVAIMVQGDASGLGNALLVKSVKEPSKYKKAFVDWLRVMPKSDTKEQYKAYRAMLDSNFTKGKFVVFDVD